MSEIMIAPPASMAELRHAAATGDHREQHRGDGGRTEPRAMRDIFDGAGTFR
jgi:hypothetical protein